MYLHFLKSEAYRASKLKCVYVLLICLFFLTFFQIMLFTKLDFFGMTQDDVYELSEEGYSAEGMSEAFNMGFNSGTSISREEADDEQFISSTVVTCGVRECSTTQICLHSLLSSLHLRSISFQ